VVFHNQYNTISVSLQRIFFDALKFEVKNVKTLEDRAKPL
jgi:hypothetical protein